MSEVCTLRKGVPLYASLLVFFLRVVIVDHGEDLVTEVLREFRLPMNIRLLDRWQSTVDQLIKSADEPEANAAAFIMIEKKRISSADCFGNKYEANPAGLCCTLAQPFGEDGWLIINETLKTMLDETLK